MKFRKFVAVLGTVMTCMAVAATGAHATPSNVTAMGTDLLLSEIDAGNVSVTRRAADGSGGLLFVINAQVGKVSYGGSKIGVSTRQDMTLGSKEVVKTAVWDITNPGVPVVVASATYTKKKGNLEIGCGSQVELVGVSASGAFVVRSGKRERHAKRKTRCTSLYLVKKRRAKTKSRDRLIVTAIGASKTVIQTQIFSEPTVTELPLEDAPSAEAAGNRLATWDSNAVTVRELTKNAKGISFKFDRGIIPMSVDLSETGQILAAGVTTARKGFLVTGTTRSELPIEFSGEAYLCGDRILEIARSPVVVDGKITNELAAIEWSIQGALMKKTSIGKDHFAAAFSCSATDAYMIRQTVPAKRAELISIKLG